MTTAPPPTQPPAAVPEALIVADICRAVAELPDRNSPEDWPDAMLVTHEELADIVRAALSAAAPARVAGWMNPVTGDVIRADRKADWLKHFGLGGKAKAEEYTVPLYESAPAEPAEASSEGQQPSSEGPQPSSEDLTITQVDNVEGRTMCIVRWQVETPAGWVGAYNREALEALIPAPTTEQAGARSTAETVAALAINSAIHRIKAGAPVTALAPLEEAKRVLAAPGGEAPAPAPAAAPDAPIQWPKARDVGRIGDMSPSAFVRVGLDSDNDVYLSVWGEDGGGSVEFCNGGGGGGQSMRTRMALIALMVAMEADNAERPARDWWARRNGNPRAAQSQKGAA